MLSFSPGSMRKRTKGPSPLPSGERPGAPRGYKGTPRPAANPPEIQHDRGKTRPHMSYRKAETDPSPGTRGVHGTDTTSRDHQAPGQLHTDSAPLILDSANAIETKKRQEIEKEKEDASTAAAATYRNEDGRSPPREESEKSRSALRRAALPNQTTATTTTVRRYIPTPTTPTTAEAGRETSTPLHYFRSSPRGRPGPDTEYPRGPDTREDVLNLRILYWKPGGIIGKTREFRDLAQLEDVHVILLGKTNLRPE
ncbi:hypothetical protein EVAR_89432_1 [Eumeta japonica]|uniref:Uncharacterized protein n=1 Tax=Eumeta variegata TaxID=151549 RepID=A0A4C1Z4H0_EUMVA|nr:hypothetical protein EVAR_89432_1 [Eumeta japonica]